MSLTMWWPSPEAFEDLTVTDIDTGWQLSAPDGTELAEWLNFWSQDEEHHVFFEKAFLAVLTNHANFILEQDGKTEDLPDRRQGNPEQAEDECPGLQPQHEPGSNPQPST